MELVSDFLASPDPISSIEISGPENPAAAKLESAATSERERLFDLYRRAYEILPVNSDCRRRAAHRLRYQVYCLENPFESAAEHPDGLEIDEFDDHAVQTLLRRRSDRAIIGGVRLILPVDDHVSGGLPFLRLCQPRVPFLDLMLPLNRTAEVSRFCISKELRRRASGKAEAPLARYATLGLIRSLVASSLDNGITHWCLVVEPALLRFLAILGLRFNPLGQPVEHHGLRQPCYAELATLLEGVRTLRPEVWEVITDEGRLAPLAGPEVSDPCTNGEPSLPRPVAEARGIILQDDVRLAMA